MRFVTGTADGFAGAMEVRRTAGALMEIARAIPGCGIPC